MGSTIGSSHVFSGRRLQSLHLGSVIEHEQECRTDSSTGVQGGRTDHESGMVNIAEGMAGNLFHEATADFKIMIVDFILFLFIELVY
jgi:hypothetical protein